MVGGSYLVRPLVETDLDTVAQIEQESRPSPWSLKQFAAELTSANSYPHVLTLDDEVIGYIIPWLIADEVQIQNIAVASNHRGKKLGELLLNIALQQGLDRGAISAILEVRESNKPAISLYTKYQFKTVGRRENYYRDGENALLMTAGPFENEKSLSTYNSFIRERQLILKKSLPLEQPHR
ncbi:MAG: ribosomal protein S18-alanine N-acetyltransferase [Chloroflexota bacterium]